MKRPLLTGVAIGAALVAIPVTALNFFPGNKDSSYIRIADDSPLTETVNDLEEDRSRSARIVRECGITSFTTDSVQNDHTGSSFFKVADASTDQLNCVVGKARASHLGLAFSRGINTYEFYNLAGDPVAYTRCDPAALVAGTCQPKKN